MSQRNSHKQKAMRRALREERDRRRMLQHLEQQQARKRQQEEMLAAIREELYGKLTVPQLRAAAKEAGITGYSKMTKNQLKEALPL